MSDLEFNEALQQKKAQLTHEHVEAFLCGMLGAAIVASMILIAQYLIVRG